MILFSILILSKSLVQGFSPVVLVRLGSSLALKVQSVIGTQWSLFNINTAARSGPGSYPSKTWIECPGNAGLTQMGLPNLNGKATTFGFALLYNELGTVK
jgi:hypothetical protein